MVLIWSPQPQQGFFLPNTWQRAEGMGSTTVSKNIMLFWNQRKHTKTVPLDPKLNVGITTTAAGAKKYKQYMSKMTTPETKEVNIFETHVIPPEDEEDNVSLQPEDLVQKPVEEDKSEAPQAEMPQTPQTQEFEVPESLVNVIPDDKEPRSLEPQDELLWWHYRLGHLPYTRMKEMMNQGTLPRRLLKVDTIFLCCLAIWEDELKTLEG